MTVVNNVPFSLLFINFFIFWYLRHNIHINRNGVLANVNTMELPYFNLFVPRMGSDTLD